MSKAHNLVTFLKKNSKQYKEVAAINMIPILY